MVIDQFKLDGAVAIIAGCGRTWLEEIASAFAEVGATVIIAGPELKTSEGAAKGARQFAKESLSILTDLCNAREIQTLVDRISSQFGRIDILVNSFNFEFSKPFLDIMEEEWSQVIDTNLTSVFHCCKAVGKYMMEQEAGRIVNIVSGLGERGLPNGAVYCASMGGVIQLTKVLALEWARKNIRVNTIAIGWMENGNAGTIEDPIVKYIPIQRRGTAEDVIPLVIFLASEASSYLSGNVYTVDGGLMARG
jgi:NAD(P)-dependent dehydrogenase (short-subunit alcohol dehydrogenase family)